MRKAPLLAITTLALAAGAAALATGGAPDDPVDRQFRETIRPFLEAHCLACHGPEKPKGDLDLSRFATSESVAADLAQWEAVQEQLSAGTMPPAKAKSQPPADARTAVLSWIDAMRKREADRHAGDPGPVRARRLSNAEYDHTIRDLTGRDLRPTREFPVDPANAAGFDNSAESLAMSPALMKKYLEAARTVADHLVLTPSGIAFAPHPTLADTDRDKYCVNRIIAFYAAQKTDHADYFQAAWRFKNREALGRPSATLDDFADEAGLSPKYLNTIWAALTEPAGDVGPIAAVQSLWRDLPAPRDGQAPPEVRAGCERMRDLVKDLREQLVPIVKNLPTRGGMNAGTQPFVLWKNRQMAANRMHYRGGAKKIRAHGLKLPDGAAKALEVPEDAEAFQRFESTFERFCNVFPDAFYIKERARVFLGDKGEQGNAGRLLSAGFHSMTGYFRDDDPLSELILDDDGRKHLDGLWCEFAFLSGTPMRQYSSYLWYERAETGFLRGEPQFDFVRAEDKDAASPEKMKRFAEVYLAKARRVGITDEGLKAIEDQFRIIAEEIRSVEKDRLDAEPVHVAALQDFAERAFRRPLSKEEREGVAKFYRTLRTEEGLSHEDAVRDTLASLLLSPNFLYRVDQVAGEEGVRPLTDYDLASRLSYFLWSSMPDRELLDLAASGELHKPEVLAAQSRRMLKDDKVRGMATEFGGNWLDFRRFEEHNSVDRGRFPTFNDALRSAMFEEPVRFFVDIAQNDRGVSEFLTGKHTFVNAPLARHYGMPAPEGDRWVRIDDATPFGRGGVVPMAVFLTKNSPGLRTSPVKRGYWVVKRLLGENIPAPPANVPDLPDDEAKLDETLREALARHRADKSCAGCHERFDGVGLAFEGYGPVGERREKDLGGRPVDTRATLPKGGEGEGIAGLRAYLETTRRDEFSDNLCRKLLAYALGRTLIPSDDATIASMRRRLDTDGGRFSALVEEIVTSPQFRNKRVEREAAE